MHSNYAINHDTVLIYKTKTPLISHHLLSEEKRRPGLTVSGLIGL